MFVIHVTRAAIGPKQFLFVYNTIHCSNVLCIQRNICSRFFFVSFALVVSGHILILCKFQYLILSYIFKHNCVWEIQDWAKLFARVVHVGQTLHAAKTTLYTVINKTMSKLFRAYLLFPHRKVVVKSVRRHP